LARGGSAKLVLRQLRKQLGDLDPATVKEVETLPLDDVEDLGEALLGFTRHDDLAAWLESHRP
jgi:hypothetical protein